MADGSVLVAFLGSSKVHEFSEGAQHRLQHRTAHALPAQICYLTSMPRAGADILLVTHFGRCPFCACRRLPGRPQEDCRLWMRIQIGFSRATSSNIICRQNSYNYLPPPSNLLSTTPFALKATNCVEHTLSKTKKSISK